MTGGHASEGVEVDAVVVGAGPNGLAAAAELVRHGLSVHVIESNGEIGGGTRSAEVTIPGLLHDLCSAVHPLGAASPCFAGLPLEAHGLRWVRADVDVAHPLDGGRAGVLHRSVDDTAAALGADGDAWRRTFAPLTARSAELAQDVLGPVVGVPAHQVPLARFGLAAVRPATQLAARLGSQEARALLCGIAAHVSRPLTEPLSASAGVLLTAMGHTHGWPVAQGGSRRITDALASWVTAHGGTIETRRLVTGLDELPPHRVALFDVSPRAFVQIAGARMPGRVRRAYERYRHGPAAFKLDLAVEGGVPWTNEAVRRAGTVHVGGTLEEVAAAEAAVHRGRMPERPFVLVAQQYLADPSRSSGDVHPVWTYAHVPTGFTGDATDSILDHIERFAPGTRDRVVGMAVRGPLGLVADNPNYVGGDIATGANDPFQLLFRPRPALHPYDTGVPNTYLCSAATPPGAGVHGMCGYHAARRALAGLRIKVER